MVYRNKRFTDSGCTVSISMFRGSGGVEEYHVIVLPYESQVKTDQVDCLFDAYEAALAAVDLNHDSSVFKRYFCSDLAGQAPVIQAKNAETNGDDASQCAISLVGQAPGSPAEIALWAYHINDFEAPLEKSERSSVLSVKRSDLTHHWSAGIHAEGGGNSFEQTESVFEQYTNWLDKNQLTLADNVLRTWLFVDDIDKNYGGLVNARRELFCRNGLTPDTHFIASSGIEAKSRDGKNLVSMDAYSLSGLRSDQLKFLAAEDYLSPTHIYGVTFERGTAVSYRDRRHVIISGTASIDKHGEILHQGNVPRQLERTLINIEALLKEAEATFDDMAHFIVYIRNSADFALVSEYMHKRFGGIPTVVVKGPVCRPGWLVEIEGIAIVPADNSNLPRF